MRLLVVALLAVVSGSVAPNYTLSLWDAPRNRTVRANICRGPPTAHPLDSSGSVAVQPWVLFLPGGGLFAEDYGWLCNRAQQSHGAVLALVVLPANDSAMDLKAPALDLLFVRSYVLAKSSSAGVVLAGHSRGAAAALIAAGAFRAAL